MSFFILGLPRSRTAWLANFMNYGGYHCYHEGLNGCYTMDEYKALLDDNRIGDANTGLFMLDFRKHFPTSRVVVIDSSIDAALTYIKDINYQSYLTTMKTKLDGIHDAMHVDINDIDNKLEEIWNYLTDGVAFNKERAEILKGFNITVNEPYKVDLEAARSLFNEQNAL